MLCSKSPWPKYEGGPIAMYAMITGLQAAGHTVKVLAANTNKYTVDPETIPADFKEKTQIEFVDLDLSISVFGAACNFLSRKSYHISRFHTKAIANKLTQILRNETFDIIQLETLQMATYLDIIRKYSKALPGKECSALRSTRPNPRPENSRKASSPKKPWCRNS